MENRPIAGKSKAQLIMSAMMSAVASLNRSLFSNEKKDIENKYRNARSGFTSSMWHRVRKDRIRSKIAKQSRRRNRK